MKSISAQLDARSTSPTSRRPSAFMAFTKKLSGAAIGSTPRVRRYLVMWGAAECFQRKPWKRVSKQATARPRSDAGETFSSQDCIAGVGRMPCVGEPRMSRINPGHLRLPKGTQRVGNRPGNAFCIPVL